MRRILINALSVTNPSGLHVLLGHMGQVADSLRDRVRLVVLCRGNMEFLRTGLGNRVEWVFAPLATRQWARRAIWERVHLRRLVRNRKACAYFTTSGIAAHQLGIPQIVFCQNPWALVSAARRRRDALKAWLQRRAYRRAMRVADTLVFLSRYMQEAFRQNAGFQERRGLVARAGVDEAVRTRAAAQASVPRKPGQIVCVSIMARHKNIEILLCALAGLRAAGHPEANLHLVGSWPDPAYELKIRALVDSLGLREAVQFAGFVSRERLEQFYAESRVFCLMSRCESFGIPAVEAQTFGVPIVTSTVCAMPEIGAAGGVYCDPDDGPAIVAALRTLLEKEGEWQRLSSLALLNAERFEWSRCSRPLVDRFAELAGGD